MSVVLVTGSNSGFGLRTSLVFARAADTVIASMRDVNNATELEAVAAAEGLDIHVLALDVRDEASVTAAVGRVVDDHGRVDVLVNNAGIGIRGAVEDAAEDDVTAIFDVNVFGTLRTIRAVLPVMRAQGSGVIVNVSSICGRFSIPYASIYSASKAAVEAISDALHYEVEQFGIRVVVVEPGIFPTSFADNRRPNQREADSPYRHDQQRWNTAFAGRPGAEGPDPDPDEVARAIRELTVDATSARRRLVGRDAELIGALYNELDDAGFERALREAIDFPPTGRGPDAQ